MVIVTSSNGKTQDFDSWNRGSIPLVTTIIPRLYDEITSEAILICSSLLFIDAS